METAMIAATDKRVYMNTFGERFPVAFAYGKECTLYDLEGKAYTDFLAGIAVNALGYAHPKVTAAICDQAQKLESGAVISKAFGGSLPAFVAAFLRWQGRRP